MQDYNLTIEQSLNLSAKQIQSLKLLSYTNQELEQFLINEYMENPLLENSQDKQGEMLDDLEQMYEKGTTYREDYEQWGEDEPSRRNDISDKNKDELREMLLDQLEESHFSKEEWKILCYLIQCLDENGFFPYDTEEMGRLLGIPEAKIRACLLVLKELEPIGVFSEDIGECLKRQLQMRGIEDQKLEQIIDDYMGDILKGRIGKVSRELQLSTTQVKEYIHLLSGLNPRPVMSLQKDDAQYIVPDVIAVREKSGWSVELNDSWMGEYKYNDYYIRMMQETTDEDLKAYFKKKLERARFIINCVEQRRETILKIATAILELQSDYFERGKELVPMSMEDVAGVVGVHTSTVSRAIKDKYLQCKKTVLMKELFTSAAVSEEEMSVQTLKLRIRTLIQEEDAKKPLSDMKLAEQLSKEGIQISRRTVAKYREQMNIPDSRQRLYL